jgi:hypothetical protein
MTGGERSSMDKAISAALEPLDRLVTKLASADGSLAHVQTDVAVIRTQQQAQGREIGEMKAKVQSLHDKVDLMPDRWESDILAAIESCQAHRDEITEVTNLAKERERARREQRKDGWFANAVKDAARPFITLIIVAAMAVGTSLAVTQCGGKTIDRDTLEEQRHVLEKVEKQLRKVNGGER